MYYEINVSLNGKHLFAIDKRSITNKQSLKIVYELLKDKFPHEEGYEIEVSYWESFGNIIDMEQGDF